MMTLAALTSAQTIPKLDHMVSRLNLTGTNVALGEPVSVSMNGGNYNLFTVVVDGNCTVLNETRPGHWAVWFSMHPGQNVTDCLVVQAVAAAGVNRSEPQVVLATNGALFAYWLHATGVNRSAFWAVARPAGKQFVASGLSSSRTWALLTASTVNGAAITYLWKNAWTASAAYTATGTIHEFSVYEDGATITNLLFSKDNGALEIASCYDNPVRCQNGNVNLNGVYGITAFANQNDIAYIWGLNANNNPVQYYWNAATYSFVFNRKIGIQALDVRACLFPGVFDAVVMTAPNASHILDGNNNTLWTGPGGEAIIARADPNVGVVTVFLLRPNGSGSALEIFANVTNSASPISDDYDFFTPQPSNSAIQPNNGRRNEGFFSSSTNRIIFIVVMFVLSVTCVCGGFIRAFRRELGICGKGTNNKVGSNGSRSSSNRTNSGFGASGSLLQPLNVGDFHSGKGGVFVLENLKSDGGNNNTEPKSGCSLCGFFDFCSEKKAHNTISQVEKVDF